MKAGSMTRRAFVRATATATGSAAAGLALTGCSGWTPRSETPEQTPGPTATAQTPPIDDGLTLIAGGTFQIGSPEDEPWRGADEALHEVTVADFYLSPTEVIQAEYLEAIGTNPSEIVGDGIPVTNVT